MTITRGATTIGTGTTDASGDFCLDVIATGSGTYNVAVTKASWDGSNQDGPGQPLGDTAVASMALS